MTFSYGNCPKCGHTMTSVPCPDRMVGNLLCMGAHFGCPPCISRDGRKKWDALLLRDYQGPHDSEPPAVGEYMKTDAAIEKITKLALKYWIEDGRPDGEEYRDHYRWGRIKVKDIHWRRASNVIAVDFIYDGGGGGGRK